MLANLMYAFGPLQLIYWIAYAIMFGKKKKMLANLEDVDSNVDYEIRKA